MLDELSAIKERMAGLNDNRLLEVVNIDFSEYTEDALKYARDELYRRGLGHLVIGAIDIINESEITFRELLLKVKYEVVEKVLINDLHIQRDRAKDYERVYNKLLEMQVSHKSTISIILDKCSVGLEDLDVYGEDVESEDHFGLELFNWKHWLTFVVKPETSRILGQEVLAAYCLRKMTTYGFSSDEIDMKFHEISLQTKDEALDLSEVGEAEEDIAYIFPWARYFARTIDVLIFSTLFNNMLKFLPSGVLTPIGAIAQFVSFALLLMVPVEALLLSTWGTTPGKALYMIKIRDENGMKLNFNQAINRSSFVWSYGMGCGVVIVEIIALINSYSRLSKKGAAVWDEKGKFKVSRDYVHPIRYIIAVLILVSLPLLQIYGII